MADSQASSLRHQWAHGLVTVVVDVETTLSTRCRPVLAELRGISTSVMLARSVVPTPEPGSTRVSLGALWNGIFHNECAMDSASLYSVDNKRPFTARMSTIITNPSYCCCYYYYYYYYTLRLSYLPSSSRQLVINDRTAVSCDRLYKQIQIDCWRFTLTCRAKCSECHVERKGPRKELLVYAAVLSIAFEIEI